MLTNILFWVFCIIIAVLLGLTVGWYSRSLSKTQYTRGFMEGYKCAMEEGVEDIIKSKQEHHNDD